MSVRQPVLMACLGAVLTVGGCAEPDHGADPAASGQPTTAPEHQAGDQPAHDVAVNQHADASTDPSSLGDPVPLHDDRLDLPPLGERATTRAPTTATVATSRRTQPQAAAIQIIEAGLVAEGLEVHDVTADLVARTGGSATVQVAALHRLNGPPRLSLFELDLDRDHGIWTVVAHRVVAP